MARVKLAITKSTPFQGKAEEFSNVYTYEDVDIDSETAKNALVTEVVNAEKAIHASDVTFVRAQMWDVGTPPNYMQLSKTLTGVGSMTPTAQMYRECAILCVWPLPRAIRITRAFRRDLRKYVHTNVAHHYELSGSGSLPYGGRASTALNAYMDKVAAPVAGVAMVAPDGAGVTGPGQTHGWLQHRQFPRGRKRST